ncbi:Pyrrolocin cluster transcription factor fsdR [Rhodotorula toruloides]|nr:Pyrrolocin cluster transcription factor fsdR [Rhodotorula toruloides]
MTPRSDKEVPCGQCTKRGKAHLCHRVPHVRPKDAEILRQTMSLNSAQPPTVPLPSVSPPNPSLPHLSPPTYSHPQHHSSLAVSAIAEVDAMRTTIDGLRTRLAGLEGILATVLSSHGGAVPPSEPAMNAAGGYGAPSPAPGFAGPALSAQYLNDYALASPYTYLPYQSAPSPVPLARSSSSNGSASSSVPQPCTTATHSSSTTAIDPPPVAGLASTTLEHATGLNQSRPELREEEVAASLSLEWMALGRTNAAGLQQQSPQATTAALGSPASDKPSSVFPSPSGSSPAHPLDQFPTPASLAEILPPDDELERIAHHALDWTNWLHAAIHGPTFRAELQEFLEAPREGRLDRADPAWLALLFAQLCCGVKHMTEEHLKLLGTCGLNQHGADARSKQYLEAALACLYRSHFLVDRQLHAVQAIVVLVVGCQDGTPSNLFPTLLSLGIALAQDLGLHRLPSDEDFAASIAVMPKSARARSLVEFETKKRVFWSLACQDWFNIVYRRTTAIQPTQVTTPLPSNAHDEDLLTGTLINRPPNEYTVAGKMLVWIQVARLVQQVFQHIDENPNPSYAVVLDLDEQLKRLLANAPPWLTSNAVEDPNLPPNADWMRTTFVISSSHKTLTLHRNFFRRFEPSRRRTLEASRAILREAAKVGDTRMWTIPYHISAAASLVCLDLFQRISPPAILVAEREEVVTALDALRRMSSFSAIASRGAALLSSLLLEESRLPPIAVPARQADEGEERPSKKQRTNSAPTPATADSAQTPHSAPAVSSASLAHLLATPPAPPFALPSGIVVASPSPASQPASFSSVAFPPPQAGFEPNMLGLFDDLPPSFMSAFLEAGFDPLDGGWEV